MRGFAGQDRPARGVEGDCLSLHAAHGRAPYPAGRRGARDRRHPGWADADPFAPRRPAFARVGAAATSEEPAVAGRIVRLLRSITRVVRDASLDGRKSTGFAGRYSRVRAAYSGAWPRWISAPAHLLTTQLLWRSRTLRRLVSRLDAPSSHAGYGELGRCRPDLVVGEGLGYSRPTRPSTGRPPSAGYRSRR